MTRLTHWCPPWRRIQTEQQQEGRNPVTTAERAELTAADRPAIAAYEQARAHYQPLCVNATTGPDTGPRISAVNHALSKWWPLIERLDRQLPRNPATRAYVDAERATWFRCRQVLLIAAVGVLQRQGMLQEVPQPEDPRSGTVGNAGRFGYVAFDEHPTNTAPIEVRVRVTPDGSVTLLNTHA